LKKLWFILLVCFLVSAESFADVDAPILRCVQVDETTGEVTLLWDLPPDPGGEFVSYVVDWSTSSTGPFTTIPVPGYTTNSYLHTTNANLNSVFYRVRTVFNAGAGADTSAPYLGVISTLFPQFLFQTDSTAVVRWNPMFSGGFPGLASSYEIYRRMGGAGQPWQLLGSKPVGDETYIDSFKVCSEDIAYRIEIANTLGNCVSVSSVVEDLFEDNTPPEIPPFDSVSVDPLTGNLILGWRPSASSDTRGYQIIYRDIIADQNIIIDSTIGINNTNYTDILASGNTAMHQYGVAAFDTCEKGIPPLSNVSSIEGWHRTIFLTVVPDYCDNTSRLTWSKYVGWNNLERYLILASVNGEPYTQVGEVSSTDSIFVHEGIDLTNNFCYIVRASDQGGARTSSSNVACPQAAGSIVADTHYLFQATVTSSRIVTVNVLTDSDIDASYYTLQRSLSAYGPFFEVDRIAYAGVPEIQLIDSTARTTETDYYYYVDILDSCGFILGESNVAKTIYLRGDFDNDLFINQIEWTSYLGWDTAGSGVQGYEVYRYVDRISDAVLANTQDPFNRFFEEPMDAWMVEGTNICYQIRGVEDIGNKYGIQSFSESNTLCFSDNARIFVPNAFHPEGFNPIFRPIISFGDHRSFVMRIFDRGGQIVFESSDPNNGWDGTQNGTECELGAYVWDIEVSNLAGDIINRRGSVLLIR